VTGKMAKEIREILSEPANSSKLRETQMMTLILSEGAEFNTFFTKQLDFWGKVVRDNNIRASG
jgi:tripartite-type tricarboxylate transporter receptor subunit TctC